MTALRARIVQLRREGKSRRQIKEILGPMSNSTLDDALRGEPPPEWTRRPNAKDDLRSRARELRAQGLDYEEIAAALGVAKSSVSLWVRDLARPARLSYEECRRRAAEGVRRYWAAERQVHAARRAAARAAAAAEIGDLTDRELHHRRRHRLLVRGHEEQARQTGRPRHVHQQRSCAYPLLPAIPRGHRDLIARCHFRVYIHESADVASAQQFWLDVTGRPLTSSATPTLKRHNPKTVRKNTGDELPRLPAHRRQAERGLYRRIEGWSTAIVGGQLTLP